MWIYDINSDDGRCLNTDGCKEILKQVWKKENGHEYNTFRLYLLYTKGSITWDYETEAELNMAHKHILNFLKPQDMDTKKEPLVYNK